MAKVKPKEIAWLKATKGRRCKYVCEVYFAIRDDGSVKYADTHSNRIGTIHSFSSKPMLLEPSTKEDFQQAFNTVIKK